MNEYRQIREIVLKGVFGRNPTSLSCLDGKTLVLAQILDLVKVHYFAFHIDKTQTPYLLQDTMTWPRGGVVFPEPSDLNINMMPFLVHRLSASLPDFAKQYIELIARCPIPYSSEFATSYRDIINQVGYLTVQEGLVPVGESQRRPGVHIERPAAISRGSTVKKGDDWKHWRNLAWGLGTRAEDNIPVDGIYMASTVANSCKMWPLLITEPEQVTDAHGGLEHMRSILGEGDLLPANELVWLTDRTPHESLPLSSDTGARHVYRQFFRLIVGPISVWYKHHNTANPLGILPQAVISDANKFS